MPETVDGSLSVVHSFGQQMCIKHLVVQLVKNLPARQETQVRFLGWEDSLEEGMATHSSILAWRIPWTEEPSGLQSHVGDLTTWGFKESETQWVRQTCCVRGSGSHLSWDQDEAVTAHTKPTH